MLYEMGMKEKEHEVYFLSKLKQRKLLPYFERIFNWGKNKTANNGCGKEVSGRGNGWILQKKIDIQELIKLSRFLLIKK